MAGTVIRPSFKFIQIGFVVVILLLIGAAVVHYEYLRPKNQPPWLPAIAALLILWPLAKALRRQFTKLVIDGEKLYYETVLLPSKLGSSRSQKSRMCASINRSGSACSASAICPSRPRARPAGSPSRISTSRALSPSRSSNWPTGSMVRRTCKLLFLLLLGIPARSASAQSPHIFYTDLESGPKGAYVAIAGIRFGPAASATSYVTVGGARITNYPCWSDTKICIQLGPASATGQVVVTTPAGASNGSPFTVRAGKIYLRRYQRQRLQSRNL